MNRPALSSDFGHAVFAPDHIWDEALAARLPSRTLAYVGDSVNELAMRLYLVTTGCDSAGRLPDSAVRLVNTSHQTRLFQLLFPTLPETDQALMRTWRNAKMPYRGAGASRGEYARATAFEAWVGYLFLTGQRQRLEDTLRLVHTAAEPSPPPSQESPHEPPQPNPT